MFIFYIFAWVFIERSVLKAVYEASISHL